MDAVVCHPGTPFRGWGPTNYLQGVVGHRQLTTETEGRFLFKFTPSFLGQLNVGYRGIKIGPLCICLWPLQISIGWSEASYIIASQCKFVPSTAFLTPCQALILRAFRNKPPHANFYVRVCFPRKQTLDKEKSHGRKSTSGIAVKGWVNQVKKVEDNSL